MNIHHLIKDLRVITLDKLTSTDSNDFRSSKQPSNIYLENLFNDYNTD